jgi:hypothetical protein
MSGKLREYLERALFPVFVTAPLFQRPGIRQYGGSLGMWLVMTTWTLPGIALPGLGCYSLLPWIIQD